MPQRPNDKAQRCVRQHPAPSRDPMAGQGHGHAVGLGASEATACEETGGPGKQWQPWTPEHPCGGQGSQTGSVLPFLAGRQYFTAVSEPDPIGAGIQPGQEGSRHGGDLFLGRAGD